jgi:hypothetical protein
MGQRRGEQHQIRRGAAKTGVLREIVVALVASTIMALMIAGGGLAAERMSPVKPPTVERMLPDHEQS